ncbi:MAG: PTS system mannose/fructose/sorbose family transporter subunit IID [Collinsella sp.]
MGPLAGVGSSCRPCSTIMGSSPPWPSRATRGSRHLVRALLAILGPHARLEFGYKQGVSSSPTLAKLPGLLPPPPCRPHRGRLPHRLGRRHTCPIASASATSRWRFSTARQDLPAMIPAAITGSAYYLLTKKNASMTVLILVVIVLAMVASAAGILA